jgi:hypothetical protein
MHVPLASAEKDPDATLDFKFDWSLWLADEEIITSIDTEKVGDVAIEDTTTFDDTSVTVWVSGGSTGQYTTVTARVTTNQGRIDDRSIRLIIKER